MMTDKPRLLDLFCGAGGCTKGYQRAGFYVVGVDIKPQPHYCGDEFYQADAMTFPLEGFDAIHASPPCQSFSRITLKKYRVNHADLIAPIRERLRSQGVPYVIENVEGARNELDNPIMLCGSMFGLTVWRHRYFEVRPMMILTSKCRHDFQPVPVCNSSVQKIATKAEASEAMDIDWMGRAELNQAIPPAYTEYIGNILMQELQVSA